MLPQPLTEASTQPYHENNSVFHFHQEPSSYCQYHLFSLKWVETPVLFHFPEQYKKEPF